jgi:hypothetical protein
MGGPGLVPASDRFSKTDAGAARGAAFAAPESGSGPLSLLFGRDSGAEESAPPKTKVTKIPELARFGYPVLSRFWRAQTR